jgi:hypothetical protein
MTEINREREPFRASNSDDLDRALEAAFAKYAAVEPRAGLEDRILANLRAELTHSQHHAWWRWGLATAFAVVVIVVGLAWRSRMRLPQAANHPSVTTPSPAKSGMEVASQDGTAYRPHAPTRAAIKRPAAPKAVVASNPKLDVFPSPRPMSEQEKMALDYVQRFPQEAALIARAQTALAQREELERNSLQPAAESPGSERQE